MVLSGHSRVGPPGYTLKSNTVFAANFKRHMLLRLSLHMVIDELAPHGRSHVFKSTAACGNSPPALQKMEVVTANMFEILFRQK